MPLYIKPNGIELNINEPSVPYARSIGWRTPEELELAELEKEEAEELAAIAEKEAEEEAELAEQEKAEAEELARQAAEE